MKTTWQTFTKGAEDAIPVFIGYLPIGIAYGVIAMQAGLGAFLTVLMSALVFAGASQFIAVGLLSVGAGPIEIAITTLFVNLRHILMSASLSPYLTKVKKWFLAILAYGVTDETYAVAITRFKEGESDAFRLLGTNIVAYLGWVGGSALGILIGVGIPFFLRESLRFALPAMFIGLLVLQIKKRLEIVVFFLAALVSSFFYMAIPGVWNIVFASIVGASLGVLLESRLAIGKE